MTERPAYSKLRSAGLSYRSEEAALLGQETATEDTHVRELGSWWPAMAVAEFLCILYLIAYTTTSPGSSDATCAAQLSPYSPFFSSGIAEWEEFAEENHLMQPSLYRGKPTKEVEEAWVKLWRFPRTSISEDKMSALDKSDVNNYVRAADGGTLGFLNVFHELHCLNTIRQYTYREQYDYSNKTAFRASDAMVRADVDHCIETLRKQLMCTPDLTPLVFHPAPERPSGMQAEFNLKRKCINLKGVQEWVVRHAVASADEHNVEDTIGHTFGG